MATKSVKIKGIRYPKKKAVKPRGKQKEMGAASLLRMAEDARNLREEVPSYSVDTKLALRLFADIHEREAKVLRGMR